MLITCYTIIGKICKERCQTQLFILFHGLEDIKECVNKIDVRQLKKKKRYQTTQQIKKKQGESECGLKQF